MYKHAFAVAAIGVLVAMTGFAKDKGKMVLPSYFLRARTVAVLVDPNAGISVDDPQANQVAQKDVETALLKWGRFETVMGTQTADLIIVIRRGHGHLVERTISDPRQNNRPGVINPTGDGIGIGAQRGPQPNLTAGPDAASDREAPHSQVEIGESEDSFAVFEGGVERPLDGSAGWRYVARDGLRPHSVPAVAEFKKAIDEADKAAAKKP